MDKLLQNFFTSAVFHQLVLVDDPKQAKGSQKQETAKEDAFVPKKEDPKEGILRFAKGEIKDFSLIVPKEGIESILPMKFKRARLSMEMNVADEKYRVSYLKEAPLDFNGAFKQGFYVKKENDSTEKPIDEVIKPGEKVTLSKLDATIFIAIVEPRANISTVDITGDGYEDISHGALIKEMISSRMDSKVIKANIKLIDESLVDDSGDLESYDGQEPDIIVAPFGTNAYSTQKISKKNYEELSLAYRKKLDSENLFNILEDATKKGTYVLVPAGNKPGSISPFLPGEGILGIGANDNDGKIADYSARNDFVDLHAKGDFNISIQFVEPNEIKGFDLNEDGKVDLNIDSLVLDQDTGNSWKFLQPYLGKKIENFTFTDEHVDEVVAKIIEGYELSIVKEDGIVYPGLIKDGKIFKPSKVFYTKDQFNRVAAAINPDISAINEDRYYYLLGSSIRTVQIKDGKIVLSDPDFDYQSGEKASVQKKGTSFAPIDIVLEIASRKTFLSDANPEQQRADLISRFPVPK